MTQGERSHVRRQFVEHLHSIRIVWPTERSRTGHYWPRSACEVPADWGLASPGLSLPFRFFRACLPSEEPLLPRQPHSPGAALAVPASGASLPAGRGHRWAEAAVLLLRCNGRQASPGAADTKGRLSWCPMWPGGVGSCCPVGRSCPAAGEHLGDGRELKTAGRRQSTKDCRQTHVPFDSSKSQNKSEYR